VRDGSSDVGLSPAPQLKVYDPGAHDGSGRGSGMQSVDP
jgi:hypothetical protein